ncbi:MAG: hypothetical protein GC151_15840 [Betaproteobacteria bacterium]|nr:hypothetical protein [Betaproteobacteria bacterium]
MRHIGFLLLLSLVLLPAHAAKWVRISDEAGISLELDKGSISRRGDAVLAWDRTTYAPGTVGVSSGDVEFRVARTLMKYDCVRRTVVPLVRAFSYSSDREVLRQNVEGSELPQPVVPDTPRERMLAMVCKVRPKPVRKAKPQVQATVLASNAAPTATTPVKESPKTPGDASSPDGKPAPVDDRKDSTGQDGKKDTAAPSEKKPEDTGKAAADKAPETQKKADKGGKAAESADESHGKASKLTKGHDAPAEHGDRDAKASKGKDVHGDKDAGKEGSHDDAKKHDVHWSYSGRTDAKHWASLSPDFALCDEGKRQSPIDIRDWVRVELDGIKFNYRRTPLDIVNNGHTVLVKYAPGSTITVGEKTYELKQFHFHRPAEERVNGRAFDMVAHLVHQAKDGEIAVVAVLLMAGNENEFLKTLWNHMPLDVGLEEKRDSVQINVADLLPKFAGYYTFMGSLTTPPCTEGVRWIVMRTPVQMSRTQIGIFSRVYDMNARPIQSSHGRLIKEVM